MTAGRLDLIFEPGTTWSKTVAWRDAASTLIDTAGYQATLEVKGDVSDAAPLLTLSTANGGVTVGRVATGTPNEYNLKWTAPPSATSLIADFGKGVWALEVTDNTGVVTRLIEGFCFFSPRVIS